MFSLVATAKGFIEDSSLPTNGFCMLRTFKNLILEEREGKNY
jgi:hypothetical protein